MFFRSLPDDAPYLVDVAYELSPLADFNFTAEGVYDIDIELTVLGVSVSTGTLIECMDETSFQVVVVDNPAINAGADVETCLDNIQLNGNTPINNSNEVVDIPVSWTLVSGPSTVQITYDNLEDPFISKLEPGEEYIFRYSFSDDPNCTIQDEVKVTVLPAEECPEPCAVEVSIVEDCQNGCTQLAVTGADTYLWEPSNGVSDPTASEVTICNQAGGFYTVFGYVNGELCGSQFIELPPCPGEPLVCDFDLVPLCNTCVCGTPYGGAQVLDVNGNSVNPADVQIDWYFNGDYVTSNLNPLYQDYEGPGIYTAVISFTQSNGEPCEETLSVETICGDDCPQISFITCADPEASHFPECAEYNPEWECGFGGFYGYVWVVDAAGQPITNLNIDWYLDNVLDANPTQVNSWASEYCDNIPVRVWGEGGCDETAYFVHGCCSEKGKERDNHLNPLGLGGLVAFPNPTSGEEVFVSIPAAYSHTNLELQLLHINGQLVQEQQIEQGRGVHAFVSREFKKRGVPIEPPGFGR